jgi:hypothetical protein
MPAEFETTPQIAHWVRGLPLADLLQIRNAFCRRMIDLSPDDLAAQEKYNWTVECLTQRCDAEIFHAPAYTHLTDAV